MAETLLASGAREVQASAVGAERPCSGHRRQEDTEPTEVPGAGRAACAPAQDSCPASARWPGRWTRPSSCPARPGVAAHLSPWAGDRLPLAFLTLPHPLCTCLPAPLLHEMPE